MAGATPPRLSAGELRDGAQVGGFFGLVAGMVAWLLALLTGWISAWLGAPFHAGAAALLHLAYVGLYVVAGAAIGALWPLRVSRWWHFGLRMIAAAAIAVTVASVSLGPAWRWSLRDWSRVGLMVPAFAWVFGGPRRRATLPTPDAGAHR